MLTVINAKTGVVTEEDIGCAPGQVLFKNCSPALIAKISKLATDASNVVENGPFTLREQLGRQYATPPTPPRPKAVPLGGKRTTDFAPIENTAASNQAAFARLAALAEQAASSLQCKPMCGCSAKPTAAQVEKMLASEAKQKPTTKVKFETAPAAAPMTPAARTKQLKTLRTQMAQAFTKNADLVETVRTSIRDSRVLNPNLNTVTTRNVKTALVLLSYFGTEKAFRWSEAQAALKGIVATGSSGVSRLAKEFAIAEVHSGTLAQTKYNLTRAFEDLVIKVLCSDEHKLATMTFVDKIQDQVDALV